MSRVRLVDGKFIYARPQSGTIVELPGSPAILHVGLWNENTLRLTQSRPFQPPAVFVEFFPVTWSEAGRNTVACDQVLQLHIVTATLAQTDTPYRDEALLRFSLIRAIKAALVDFAGAADDRGRSFSRFKYYGSSTDHNHEQLCEDLEQWQTHCVDCSAAVDDGSIITTTNVSLDTGDIFTDAFSDSMV